MVRYLGHVAVRGCRTVILGHVQDIPCQSPEHLNIEFGFVLGMGLD